MPRSRKSHGAKSATRWNILQGFALVHHPQGARGQDRTHHHQTPREIQFVKTTTTRTRAVDGEPIVSADTFAQSAKGHTQSPSARQRARTHPPLQAETKDL